MVTTKVGVADILGISSKTVYRHLKDISVYDCDRYCIWKNIEVPKKHTGFAIKVSVVRYKQDIGD